MNKDIKAVLILIISSLIYIIIPYILLIHFKQLYPDIVKVNVKENAILLGALISISNMFGVYTEYPSKLLFIIGSSLLIIGWVFITFNGGVIALEYMGVNMTIHLTGLLYIFVFLVVVKVTHAFISFYYWYGNERKIPLFDFPLYFSM